MSSDRDEAAAQALDGLNVWLAELGTRNPDLRGYTALSIEQVNRYRAEAITPRPPHKTPAVTREQCDAWRANAAQGGTATPDETLTLLGALTAAAEERDAAQTKLLAVQAVLDRAGGSTFVRASDLSAVLTGGGPRG